MVELAATICTMEAISRTSHEESNTSCGNKNIDENTGSGKENEKVATAAGVRRGVDTARIPSSIAHLVASNSEFAVLLCVKPGRRRAQTVKGIEEHLRSFHHEKPAIRREAGQFGQILARQDARFLRDYTVVELPVNKLAPSLLCQS